MNMRRTAIEKNKEFGTQAQGLNDNFAALYGEIQRMRVEIDKLKKDNEMNKKYTEVVSRFFGG